MFLPYIALIIIIIIIICHNIYAGYLQLNIPATSQYLGYTMLQLICIYSVWYT